MPKTDKTDKADRDKDATKGRKGEPRQAQTEHWKTEPDDHDYPAAADYMSLLAGSADVGEIVERLRTAPIVRRKAKDLFRASRLRLLPPDNPHVAEDLEKVRRGELLSPVLIVRGDFVTDVAMTIADGYHRICASYHLTENAEIPCRLVEPPARPSTTASDGASRARRRSAAGGGPSAGTTRDADGAAGD
jgi:hypothetical protein